LDARKLPSTLEDLRGLRAARWVRESTPGQFDRYGPEAQRGLQDVAIARLGMVDTGREWRAAHSGRTVYRTPEMASMLASAGRGEFSVLVVGYVSRWQRNLQQTLNLLEDVLKPAGVAVYFADEEILSSCDRHWDQLVDEAKDAERFSRKHSRRVGEGYAAKRTRTGVPGGNKPPYGFIRTQDTPPSMIIDEEKMATVRRAYSLSAGGNTDGQVADAIGLKKTHVTEILTNPVYRGMLHGGEKAAGGAPIDQVLWDRVQERRRSHARRKPGRGTLTVYPLSQLIYCAACGRMLTAHTGRFRHIDPCEDFMDATPADLKWAKHNKSYSYDLFEGVVPAILSYVSANANLAEDVIRQLNRTVAGPDPASLARIEHEQAAARDKWGRDRDTDALLATTARLDREREQASEARRELPSAEDARRFLGDLPYLWAAADPEKRQLLARTMFERIDVLGVEQVRITPTQEAREYGWFEAWAGKTLRVPLDAASLRYGRGERI
jgi:DNA invertase Pin-like site-specific DNA recombinase